MNPQQQPQNFDRELSSISEVITKSNSGLIVLPAKPTQDAIASGTALYLALTKLGKTVSLICAQVPESDIVGTDKIQTTIQTGGNNLVISFPYVEGAIDKVDYGFNADKTKFNVIVMPREGSQKLQPKDVEFTYSGGKIEFIITVDAPNLNNLGDIYTKNQSTFDGKNIINIDRHLINNNFGTINLVVKTAAATAELVLKVLQTMKVQLDKDIATNLYTGIVNATNNFSSYSVNADTFETVADLLRAGAVKKPMRQFSRPGMPTQMGQNPFGQGMSGMQMPQMNRPMNRPQQQPMRQPVAQQMPQPMPQMQPQQSEHPQPINNTPMPQQQSFDRQSRAVDQIEQINNTQDMDDNISEDSESWLKPKIFTESDGLV